MVEVTSTFANELARLLGVDNSDGWFTNFLREWQKWEGGTASHNPLNTTQRMPGSSNYNDLGGGMGVQHFPDEQTGILATYKTLINGYYPELLNAIHSRQITPGAIANLRTWGTKGFANSLEGGAPIGGSDVSPMLANLEEEWNPDDFSQEAEQLRELITSIILRTPELEDYDDPEEWLEALGFWRTQLSGVAETYSILKGTSEGWAELPDGTIIALADATPEQRAAIRTANENRYRQHMNEFNIATYDLRSQANADERKRILDEFNAKMDAYQADLDFDATNIDRAGAEIGRFLEGKAESRARTQLLMDEHKLLSEWGTSPGKSSFTGRELGGAISKLMELVGVSPDSNAISYTGTRSVDLAGDMARFDKEFGVSGPLPEVPSLITDPLSRPGAPSLPSGPTPPSLIPMSFDFGSYNSSTTPGATPNHAAIQPAQMGVGGTPFQGGDDFGSYNMNTANNSLTSNTKLSNEEKQKRARIARTVG